MHRLKENLGAAALELTEDDLRQIEGALAHIKVQGDRYPAHLAARGGQIGRIMGYLGVNVLPKGITLPRRWCSRQEPQG